MPDPFRRRSSEEQEQVQKAQEQIKTGDRSSITLVEAGVGEALPKASSPWAKYAYPLHTYAYQVPTQLGEPVIEMDGVTVRYGDKTVFSIFWHRRT